jgi:hypothetical protein
MTHASSAASWETSRTATIVCRFESCGPTKFETP